MGHGLPGMDSCYSNHKREARVVYIVTVECTFSGKPLLPIYAYVACNMF